MTSESHSSSSSSHDREPKVDQHCKVFITNIDGQQDESTVERHLRDLFEKYGQVSKLSVKKNKNGQYSFAFLEFLNSSDATKAIAELDQF